MSRASLVILVVLLLTWWSRGYNLQDNTVVYLNVPGVSRVAIWRSRAFLLVPSLPTSLLEVTWQPSLAYTSRVRRFPPVPTVRRCHGLQAVTDLKTDSFGRLWVLDGGSNTCRPKLLIYDMLLYILNDNVKHTFDFGTLLTDFVVDPGTSRSLSMAYLAGSDQLYVYSVYQDRSWSVSTSIRGDITGLTINKGGIYQRSALFVEVDHQIVYQIFTSSLLDSDAHAEKVGYLLGPNSAGILSDTRGGVYYMLARDFVALKWDSSLPLEAESHGVILQSDSLLHNVTYLTFDSQRSIWAVVNNGTDKYSSWCVKLSD